MIVAARRLESGAEAPRGLICGPIATESLRGHKWGGQFCPQPAFSRLQPPKKAAAANIGRPPSPQIGLFMEGAGLNSGMTTGASFARLR
jgi:hypothetical protein